MAPKKEKKPEFQWEAGSRLQSDDYEPLGQVREVGFSKMADGVYADPAQRKEARKKKLLKTSKPRKEELVIEESQSGLKDDFTPSEASRLIHKDGTGFKGINRFQKPGEPSVSGKSPSKKK